jgi:phosphohistidine swiveling domain-containing protein
VARLIALDEDGAQDASRVGVKAARLAVARRLGFAVLPGVVVPVEGSAQAIEVGVRALELTGLGSARPAVAAVSLPAWLEAALREALPFEGPLIARASTTLDDQGVFAGAFASVGELGPEDLATAVRGCWASVFAPDAIERLQRVGLSPAAVGMAILIQPELRPVWGGWAARTADGGAEVASIAGSPAPLLGGLGRGRRHVFSRDGTFRSGDTDRASMAAGDAERAASLLFRAHAELGADRIEWADDGAALVLLQLDRAPPEAARSTTALAPVPAAHRGTDGRVWRRFAQMMIGRSGSLADRLVAPWAAAAPGALAVAKLEGDPAALFASAIALGAELAATLAFQSGIPTAVLTRRLLEGDPALEDDLGGIEVDAGLAGRVLGAIDAVGAALAGTRTLADPVAVWWQDEEWIKAALTAGPPRPPRTWVPDRWTNLLFDVVTRNGTLEAGQPASPGRVTGRLVVLSRPEEAGAARARDIIVVDDPVPGYAPLLWSVAGVVSREGDPAAHLFEVARSRRIPAVAGIGPALTISGDAMAIDGDAGEVRLWPMAGQRTRAD